ncbi:GGDEF domain-containing protein [Methylomarinum sp. Ch1-1]|uniref:diguanylate cyclase n=1 Tax=Methylomarinum roseum TaxID=3067653 RepID=A0AAU7NSW1_9GAMM|nr:GGDEF domain-containing protein [Methylomarinum sp. Ch1-1]MDP4519996.1 GGDEF domain-containing protein [Methylomarinum sp. Ch1-1]
MKKKITNLALVNNKTYEAAKTANLHHYDISSALQTTLDFNELIAIFCDKIQAMIPHNGVLYRNPLFNLEYHTGISTRHSCSYSLSLEEQSLGELKLMRQQRFSDKELNYLETLLCCLIYPLKNATLYRQALQMAYTDPLTKTKNRTAFNDTIEREYRLANRNANHLSLIFLDIDWFKTINDSCGHEGGDTALTSVANLIKDSVRGSDLVFRYGGEEFVVLLSETNLEDAGIIAERIRMAIENHTLAYGLEILNMTASLGVSSLRGNDSIESLINRADSAMYQAKMNGKNNVKLAK